MRTRISWIFASLLVLAACGSSVSVECTQSYWDGDVGTCLPDGWHVLDRANLDDRGVPGEALVAFQTDEAVAGQYLTVVVTREDLAEETLSSEYSKAGVASVRTLPGYQRVEEQTVQIGGEDHVLHVFTAQPNDDQPIARFMQLSLARGKQGYTFTAATPLAIDDTSEEAITRILENATLTDPAAATE